MKITSMEIWPEHPSNPFNTLHKTFSFGHTPSLPYNVKHISGLDADEIISGYYGTFGNTPFNSNSLLKREIVILLNLNPTNDETISSLRDDLYKTIAAFRTGKIQLKFINESPDVEVVAVISGYISKFETAHFEKTQEVQLTIECSDPMFRAPTAELVDVSDFTAFFTISDYKSTAPHGLEFVLNVMANCSDITITDPSDSSWAFQTIPGVLGFLAGDEIHFSSEHSNKYLYVVRDADTIPIADTIRPGSVWPIMFPGENKFSINNALVVEWDSISYYPTYWGV